MRKEDLQKIIDHYAGIYFGCDGADKIEYAEKADIGRNPAVSLKSPSF
ncbi:MAG: hypothetical protein U0L49_08300 [Eubacterium sp.]|nr:hypothetical protein [Eubacterium sp.]